jgi:hypothetical protein
MQQLLCNFIESCSFGGATGESSRDIWTGKHLILQPLVENLLVICHVLWHGSLGVVEEVRYKDTQLRTFVLESRRSKTSQVLRIPTYCYRHWIL